MKPRVKAAAISAGNWALALSISNIGGRVLARATFMPEQLWDSNMSLKLAFTIIGFPFVFILIFAWKYIANKNVTNEELLKKSAWNYIGIYTSLFIFVAMLLWIFVIKFVL